METLELIKAELQKQRVKEMDLAAKIYETKESLKQADEALNGLTRELIFVKGVIQSLDFSINIISNQEDTKEEK
jgi:hypothetical protein